MATAGTAPAEQVAWRAARRWSAGDQRHHLRVALDGRWVDAPVSCGPRETLYNRFARRAGKRVRARPFQALAAAGGPPAELLLDSTHVKAHRGRNAIERMVCRLEDFRRIATRYDKPATNFLAAGQLATIVSYRL